MKTLRHIKGMSGKFSDFKRKFKRNIERRRKFRLDGYKSLTDVCDGEFDGEYVTPLQMKARSATGICLISHYWFDVEGLEKCTPESKKYQSLKVCGYTTWVPFNKVLDLALKKVDLRREDTYMTQVFHLLPLTSRQGTHKDDVWESFKAITQHEVRGRKAIALGRPAQYACERAQNEFGDNFFENFVSVYSPAWRHRRGMTEDKRANDIAEAIRKIL